MGKKFVLFEFGPNFIDFDAPCCGFAVDIFKVHSGFKTFGNKIKKYI
jgi:hypothetical protein